MSVLLHLINIKYLCKDHDGHVNKFIKFFVKFAKKKKKEVFLQKKIKESDLKAYNRIILFLLKCSAV